MIAALHAWARRRRDLTLATTITRWLLAIGFIPPGLTKVLGHRFTTISPEGPIGYFFDAFFQSGLYYGFVGSAQVVAGLLLLFPRTALIGALLYLPIIANIFVITVALQFTGTWVIAGLMLAATLYLLFWDLDRLLPLIGAGALAVDGDWRSERLVEQRATDEESKPRGARLLMRAASGGLGAGLLVLMLGARGLLPQTLTVPALAVTVVCLPFALGSWVAFLRKS